ncbi:MAG TPA: galactokinase family protein [Rectinemataceae bacterium]|nr:galactokinase family protein [Rectinemataceae bacterium]
MAGKAKDSSSIGGKAAKKALAGLYGKGVAAQAERYSRLASLLRGDLEAASLAGEAGQPRFYSAPGRTELGGNHTDHNHGQVLCAAVSLDAVACAVRLPGTRVSLVSDGYADPVVLDLATLEPLPAERGKTAALVRGVARGLADRGIAPVGFAARINSTVLPGSGLSSSAAIEVLLGSLMADLAGSPLSALEIAKIGQFAENEFFGKPCGLMDQTASAVGGVVSIDFADPRSPKVKRLEFDFEAEGYRLVVVGTGGSHEDLTAEYAAIPGEMRAAASFLGAETLGDIDPSLLAQKGPELRAALGDRALLRAFHFMGEDARVPAMVKALKAGDLKAYLKLVKKSGDSSWRLLQNISPSGAVAEQGIALALALSAEMLGAKGAWRVHGGGFAGTIQAYVPAKLLAAYTELMEGYFGAGCVIPVSIRAAGAGRVL